MPFIAITPWRRTLSTWVHPESDLYTLNPDYVRGVEKSGGQAALVPHVATTDAAREMLERFDGLIVSGGSDVDPSYYGHENTASFGPDPTADASDLAFVRAAHDLGMPMLAICRGAQILNVAFGGTLHQHIWSDSGHHPARSDTGDATADSEAFLALRHPVELTPDSLAARIFDTTTITTNTLHHQSVDEPGAGLTITGTAPDGIVEVIEHDSGRLLGVQWHPERLTDEGHQPLFDWLIESATVSG